jgi:predicted nuclease of predicted toxin-antitoxin system
LADRVKFYTDEHVPFAVTQGLRRRGVDVLTVQEAGMQAAGDEEHLALALSQKRVIVEYL